MQPDGQRFPVSQQWEQRARKTDAWAATRGDILEVDAANRGFPQYFEKAQGAYVWDVDGNRYVDYTLGYGPVVLGHAHPGVTAAVTAQLARGTCASPLWSPLQVELTEVLVDVIPGAEQAYLLRTGSDATAAAVRLARLFTGREKVARWGYNGWHDWCAPRTEGVPRATLRDTLTFSYNDIASLDQVLSEHPGQVACVIMMPYELEGPEPGFLPEVKSVAHRHGALFILDEMRSGFRISLGGAQEYFGIQADLSTFSKAMANGYCISAVVGRRDIMMMLGRTHMSSTFYGNPAEMAAALTTIRILRDTDPLPRMLSMGARLQQELSKLVANSDFPAEVVGLPVSPFLQFAEAGDARARRLKVRFFGELLRRGIFFHPNHQWFISAAHTEADLDMTIAVCKETLDLIMS
jgi:glutamate-1-semialdehyde aminotransferase